MSRVLVTGGTGVLGRELVKLLRDDGHTVRIMSRRPPPTSLPAQLEWAQASLAAGTGLAEAVRDVQVIFHAASATGFSREGRQVDVEGTRLLLEAARQANVSHVINISIVGIDRIPFSYYKVKLAAEKVIAESSVPWTNLRTTQFHNFIDILLQMASRLPIMPLPTDFPFQPVEVTEVAAPMVRSMEEGPSGRLPDMGGPEVIRLGEMVRGWLRARGMNRLVVRLPLWGKTADGFRRGDHTCSDCVKGKVTWAEWLKRTYSKEGHSDERIYQP
jgi:uncharacterized protein YbjT (DUF2867 family)